MGFKFFILCFFLASQVFARGPVCELTPENGTPALDHDVIWFRLYVQGADPGQYKWRIPLKKSFNGRNKVALSKIGYVNLPSANGHLIDLSVADIERTGNKPTLDLELEKDNVKVATCSTPAAGPRFVALGRSSSVLAGAGLPIK